jgi:hypothetical protein
LAVPISIAKSGAAIHLRRLENKDNGMKGPLLIFNQHTI